LENIAIRLHVAGGREHRALPDARLVKDVFLELLQRTPTVKSIADLMHISATHLADASTASNPPPGLCASRTSCPIETDESCDLLRLPGDEDACLGAIYFSRTSS
jgi:DNA polymerase III epsilon subunit-like protein